MSLDHHLVPTLHGDGEAPAAAVRTERIEPRGQVVPGLGAGDSAYVPGFVSDPEALLARLGPGGEVPYQQWYHMPDPKKPHRALRPLRRIKAAMATAPDAQGRVPHYRFPVNDQCRYGVISPMTPAVEALRLAVEAWTGQSFNHAVVLAYRDGQDSIGFHKDKMLDLDPEGLIACVSLGAARPFVLRDDIFAPTREQEVLLEPGSLYVLGPRTNLELYHAVPATPSAGLRVSVTFRRARTFRDPQGRIYGQGAEHQCLNWPEVLKGAHRLDADLEAELPREPAAR